MRIQAIGNLLNLKKASLVPAFQRSYADTLEETSQFLQDHGHPEIALQLRSSSRPRDFIAGTKSFAERIAAHEDFRTALAKQIELDANWSDLALLRVAGADDTIVESARQYFSRSSRALVGDIGEYSIQAVQTSLRRCQRLGLWDLALQNNVQADSVAATWAEPEEIIGHWQTLWQRMAIMNWSAEALSEKINTLKKELVDHPVFGELFIHKVVTVVREPQDLEAAAVRRQGIWLETHPSRALILMAASPYENPVEEDPAIIRYGREAETIHSKHRDFLGTLPVDDPRIRLSEIQMMVEESLRAKYEEEG